MSKPHRDVAACRQLLIFGTGNLDVYAYSIPDAKYQALDRFTLDVAEELDSFDELLAKALEAHL